MRLVLRVDEAVPVDRHLILGCERETARPRAANATPTIFHMFDLPVVPLRPGCGGRPV